MAYTPYGLTYGLAQLGSQMMPQYYAAESRALKSETDRMGVEALREDMAAKRRAQEEAAAVNEAYMSPETAGETLRGQGYGRAAMKADQDYALLQEQAMKQQEQAYLADYKQRSRNFVKYVSEGRLGQAAEQLGADDLQIIGDQAYLTTGGNTGKMPLSVLVASMTGDPNDYATAIQNYGKEVRKEELERAKLGQRKQESERRYQQSIQIARAKAAKMNSGSTALMKNVDAYAKVLINNGVPKPEAIFRAWEKQTGDRALARSIAVTQRQLKEERESDYPDPAAIETLQDQLAELMAQNRRSGSPTGGSTGKIPPPPPGKWK